MKGAWHIARRNLARNRRRNFATGVAIAVGFMALLAIGGYATRLQNFFRVHSIYVRETGHLVIYQKGGLDNFSRKPAEFSLNKDAQGKIEQALHQLPNIAFFMAQLTGSGLIGNGCKSVPFLATGIDPKIDQLVRQQPDIERWTPQFKDVSHGKGLWEYPADYGAVAISEGLAKLLGKPSVVSDFPGKPPLVLVNCQEPNLAALIAQDANVQFISGRWAGGTSVLDGEIVAHFSTGITDTNNMSVLTPLGALQKLFDTENVTFYSIWLTHDGALPETLQELQTRLAKEGLSLDIYPWHSELVNPMYKGILNFFYTLVTFIATILALIIVFSIFNTTTITVLERASEIGMMRSLGYTTAQIEGLYMRETSLLALIGTLAGTGLGLTCIELVNQARIEFKPPGIAGTAHIVLVPNLWFGLVCAALIWLLTLATTWVAIRKMAKKSIPDLLAPHK